MRPTLSQIGAATGAAIVVLALFLLIEVKPTIRAKPSNTRTEIVYFGTYRHVCPPEPVLTKKEQRKAILVVDWPMVCPFEVVVPHA